MKTLAKGSLAIVVLLGTVTFAQAQAADSKGCSPQERSDKILEHDQSTAGVICPPDIDQRMKAPTPQTGDRSVISPPGTPGGDQTMKPKN
jgi:hypothetical protein